MADDTEATWLTEECRFSMSELVELSGLTEVEVRELVEYGAIAPMDPDAPQWAFTGRCLTTVRMARRLRTGFDLEPHGMALVVSLLERISELEAQITKLHAQAPRRLR